MKEKCPCWEPVPEDQMFSQSFVDSFLKHKRRIDIMRRNIESLIGGKIPIHRLREDSEMYENCRNCKHSILYDPEKAGCYSKKCFEFFHIEGR